MTMVSGGNEAFEKSFIAQTLSWQHSWLQAINHFGLSVWEPFFLRIGFVGFMMTNYAANRSTSFAVPSHVAGHSANDCAFDAPLGLGWR